VMSISAGKVRTAVWAGALAGYRASCMSGSPPGESAAPRPRRRPDRGIGPVRDRGWLDNRSPSFCLAQRGTVQPPLSVLLERTRPQVWSQLTSLAAGARREESAGTQAGPDCGGRAGRRVPRAARHDRRPGRRRETSLLPGPSRIIGTARSAWV